EITGVHLLKVVTRDWFFFVQWVCVFQGQQLHARFAESDVFCIHVIYALHDFGESNVALLYGTAGGLRGARGAIAYLLMVCVYGWSNYIGNSIPVHDWPSCIFLLVLP